MIKLDNFTKHYLICALWLGLDNDDNPMDELFNIADLPDETIEQAIFDCLEFQTKYAELLKEAYVLYDDLGYSNHPDAGSAEACAGHDFYLTRCGHGTGFWDRGLGEVGDKLTKACENNATILYIGDDGLPYFG